MNSGASSSRDPASITYRRVFSFPALAVDRSGGANGNVYVVWADELGTGSGPDILLSRSTDGGATWSAPIRVSDDTNGSYQFMPAIAVMPNGTVVVSFFDQRNTPGSTEYDIYAARSTNGGRSFRRNHKISNRTSDSTLDGFSGFFIGDYSGLAVSRYHAFPYWTDTRPAHENPRSGRRLAPGTIMIQGHDPTTNLSFRNLRIALVDRRAAAR